MRALALILALLAPGAAHADGLLLSLSSREITIASNYQGAEVTLFGAALDKDGNVGPPFDYDIVAIARGPAETLAVREKERNAGLWLNSATRRFADAPSYLSVLSSRPLSDVASPEIRARDELGLEAAALRRLPGAPVQALPKDAPFVGALIRLQEQRKLWSERASGVTFIGPSLFQGAFQLPANVPLGDFEVEARLMRGGETVARETVRFRVVKAGFEAKMAGLAESQRLAYGAATMALALLFGWLASVIFRRD